MVLVRSVKNLPQKLLTTVKSIRLEQKQNKLKTPLIWIVEKMCLLVSSAGKPLKNLLLDCIEVLFNGETITGSSCASASQQ